MSETQGALDHDFDEHEQAYEDQIEEALEGVQTEPMTGDVAIDLVTRQIVFVHERVADSLEEYYEENDFDLATYKQHPWLPVRPDDAVFECVFVGGVDDLHKPGKTYDYPRGRLARIPVDLAWRDAGVDGL
jgi:hypothetical protein